MNRITPRQLAFAYSLGIIPRGPLCREQLSAMIDHALEHADGPPTPVQIGLGRYWDREVSGARTRNDAASTLFHWWEELSPDIDFPPGFPTWDQLTPRGIHPQVRVMLAQESGDVHPALLVPDRPNPMVESFRSVAQGVCRGGWLVLRWLWSHGRTFAARGILLARRGVLWLDARLGQFSEGHTVIHWMYRGLMLAAMFAAAAIALTWLWGWIG